MDCEKFNQWANCSVIGRLTIIVIASCIITVCFGAVIWFAQRLGLIEVVKTTTENSIILVFVGFLAGFIVLNNFQQVEDIKKELDTKIKNFDNRLKPFDVAAKELKSITSSMIAEKIINSSFEPVNITLVEVVNEEKGESIVKTTKKHDVIIKGCYIKRNNDIVLDFENHDEIGSGGNLEHYAAIEYNGLSTTDIISVKKIIADFYNKQYKTNPETTTPKP